MTAEEKRKALADYLASAHARLFSKTALSSSMLWLRDSDLDTLILLGGGCRSAIHHIREAQDSGKRFGSFLELFQALSDARVLSGERRQDILEFLQSPECSLVPDQSSPTAWRCYVRCVSRVTR